MYKKILFLLQSINLVKNMNYLILRIHDTYKIVEHKF